jgi:MFS transporter, ACS family, tartrate transporter
MSDPTLELATMRRVCLRILPLLSLGYIFAYLDRSNVGIAALQMNQELGFTPAVFGLGAGIFFLGYAAFEVPSNLILLRTGARIWVARIAISWGIIAGLTMLVRSASQFYVARLLLGVAEAGFFPGIVYYIGCWFPAAYRARALAAVLIGSPISQVLGGTLGGALLGLSGHAGLSGWQWLFLLEGIPSILLGMAVLRYLTEQPQKARWLSAQQRDWLTARLSKDEPRRAGTPTSPLRALANPFVWVLTVPYFALFSVTNAYISWAPTLVRDALGTRDTTTGLAIAAIAVVAGALYPISGRLSDRRGVRCGQAAFGLALQFAGCAGVALFPHSLLRVLALALIPMGLPVFMAPFWCLPSKFLRGPSSAAGIALINTVGTIGGFFGPSIVGVLKQATGGDTGAFAGLAVLALAGSLLCYALRKAACLNEAPLPAAEAAPAATLPD